MRGGMGNMQNMMKQMQKMQKKMEEEQQKLKEEQIEGTAGGGKVKVTVSEHKEKNERNYLEVINMRGGIDKMQNMMKQMQKMQKKMEEEQQKLKEEQIEGTAGGGMVKVTVSGHKEILDVEINEEVVDPEDIEMLQDLITAATNDALSKADELVSEKLGQHTKGLNIPG